jgi:hypothetical protein
MDSNTPSRARSTRAERELFNDAEAARLRALRFSYDQIAEKLGYADKSGAWRAVRRGLATAVREPTHEAILLDLDELNRMARGAWTVLGNTHYVVDRGEVVFLNEEPVLDDGPVLAAIGRLLDIQARRAKLLGLDAPTKSRVEVVTEDAVDAEIRRLEATMAELEDVDPVTSPD